MPLLFLRLKYEKPKDKQSIPDPEADSSPQSSTLSLQQSPKE